MTTLFCLCVGGFAFLLVGIWWQLVRIEAILLRLARERGVVLFDEGRRQV